MKKWRRIAAAALAAALLTAGCGQTGNSSKPKLDPKNPVSLTIWHYYNGSQQVAFDELVEQFNNTQGKEQGIYVEAHSQGNVNELESKVLDAFNKVAGSDAPPNIFSSYADTAYAIEKMGELVDIGVYMTEEEQATYVDSFVEEGRIGTGGELRIFPTAKSSEVMMLNKTAWDQFAKATGASLDQLKTKEGLVETAGKYYEWTDAQTPDAPNDGKAFYGRDAMANLTIIGSMQLGTELFSVKNNTITLNVDKDVMRQIWDFYYVPFVKGWFGASGRFRSDDLKIGKIAAFTGSTSSALYFPDKIETDDNSYPIDYLVLPDPGFKDGKNVAVQQGAGMVVTKGTPEQEYASVEFLKWFTQEKNNLSFGSESGYLPVKKKAYDKELLDQVIQENNIEISPKTYDTLTSCFENLKDAQLYTNKAFDNGAAARKVVDTSLSDRAAADRAVVLERLNKGQNLSQATADFVGDDAFNAWFDEFNAALKKAIAG